MNDLRGASGPEPVSGAVLQVVQVVKTDTEAYTGTDDTWAALDDLTLTVTPKKPGSKFLVKISVNGAGSNSQAWVRITRDGTAIGVGVSGDDRIGVTAAGFHNISEATAVMNCSSEYLDSPDSAASITYAVEQRYVSGTFYINRGATSSNDVNHAVASSTLTVMEIAG